MYALPGEKILPGRSCLSFGIYLKEAIASSKNKLFPLIVDPISKRF